MAVASPASQGNFELNVFKPVIVYNLLQSIRAARRRLPSFARQLRRRDRAQRGAHRASTLEPSLMLVTALNPHIGYDNAAKIAKKALAEDIGVREAAIASGLVTAEQYDAWVKPEDMLGR